MAKRSKNKTKEEYILNVLRQGTLKWEGRNRALRKARKKVRVGDYKNGKPKYKFHWQCAECLKWESRESSFEVDHIVEIGGFKGDWNDIIERAYDEDNLQVLCVVCHQKKTSGYNARLLFKRKPLRESV